MNFEPLKQFMDYLTSWRIPGNTAVVYKDGEKVFEYSSGCSDIENKIPMTSDRYFYMYSCTKIITTLAALKLYEQGRFLLDDPVSDYIPEFGEMYVKGEDGNIRKAEKQITMRHLFTMTSGLSYDLDSDSIQNAIKNNKNAGTLEIVRAIAGEPLLSEPGEIWRYGLNHDVLAAVVEIISGKRFSDYVRDNIFKPAGADIFFQPNDEIFKKMAVLYKFINDGDKSEGDVIAQQISKSAKGGKIVRQSFYNCFLLTPQFESGGAGSCATVDDFGKVLAAIANGGVTKGGHRIVSRGTIELWRTNQLTKEQMKGFTWEQTRGYGYGLGVRTMIDRAKSGSTGAFGGFGWGGAAGANAFVDVENNIAMFYAHHMLNQQEVFVQPRLRNVLYTCMENI